MPTLCLSATRSPCLRVAVCATLLAVACGGAAQAQVYVGHGDNGVVILSDRPSEDTPVLLVAAPPEPVRQPQAAAPSAPEAVEETAVAAPIPRLPDPLRQLIHDAAQAHRVSPALIAAIAAAESAFNVKARSSKGAAGMMQLMPATAKRFNVANRYSAIDSLKGAAAYLRWLSDHFGDNIEKTIAAYNAGEGAVDRAGGIPPFAETQAYVPRVLRYMRHFERALILPLAIAPVAPRV